MIKKVKTKRCPSCENIYPLTSQYWHKNKSRGDGFASECKKCKLAYLKRYAQTPRGKANKRKWDATYLSTPNGRRVHTQSRKVYSKTDKGKEVNRIGALNYSEKNPEKRKAHQILNNAIRDGKIERPDTCEKCGKKKPVEAHHEDYSKPLDVDFWCKDCHTAYHVGQRRLARANN
ncbi:MAG: hypothetical protein ACTSQY_02755 [Candidatus Odinarchaeia archaeon]